MSLLLLSGIRAVGVNAARPTFGRRRRALRERYDDERNAAAITRYVQRQAGDWVRVTATLSVAGAWVHWFVNGKWHGRTRLAARSFYAPPGVALDIRAVACRYAGVDWRELRGALPQGLRTVEWVGSTDVGAADYAVQTSSDGGSTWSTVAVIPHDGRYRYVHAVGPLADDTVWRVQIVPRLATGETGTAISVLNERIVRPPDPISYGVSYDGGTHQVTVTA